MSQTHTGSDFKGCGSILNPCRTITYAMLLAKDGDVLSVDVGSNHSSPYKYHVDARLHIMISITIQGRYPTTTKHDVRPTIFFNGTNLIGRSICSCNKLINIIGLHFTIQSNIRELYYLRPITWFHLIPVRQTVFASIKNCSFHDSIAFGVNQHLFGKDDSVILNVKHSTLPYYSFLLALGFYAYIPHITDFHVTITNSKFLITNSSLMKASIVSLSNIPSRFELVLKNSTFQNSKIKIERIRVHITNSTFQSSDVTITKTNQIFGLSRCVFLNSFLILSEVTKGYVNDTLFEDIHTRNNNPLFISLSKTRKIETRFIRISGCLFQNISLNANLSAVISINYMDTLFSDISLVDIKVIGVTKATTIIYLKAYSLSIDTFKMKNVSIHCGSRYVIRSYLKNNEYGKALQIRCALCSNGSYHFQGGYKVFYQHFYPDVWKHIFKTFDNRKIGKRCQQCPPNGKCDEGRIRSKGAYWGYNDTLSSIKFLSCPRHYCCPSLQQCLSYNTCANNRQGRLCSDCKPGFSCSLSSDYLCVPNKKCNNTATFVILLCVLSVFIAVSLLFLKEFSTFIKRVLQKDQDNLYKKEDDCQSSNLRERLIDLPSYISEDSVSYQEVTSSASNIDQDHYRKSTSIASGSIKILFFFYQAASIIRIQSPAKLDITIPRCFDVLLTLFNVKIDISYSSTVVCIMPNLDVVQTELLKSSITYLTIFCLLLIWGSTFLYHRLRNEEESHPVTYTVIDENVPNYCRMPMLTRVKCAYLQFLLISFAGIATFLFTSVHCVAINDNLYLFQQASIKCYQPWQYLAFVGIVTWVVPFPFALYFASKRLHTCGITPSQFIAVMTFPPISLILLAKALINNSPGKLSKKDAIDAKHLLLVINEPFRESEDNDGSRMCWEIMFLLRRTLLIVMKTFILSPITKLYPMAILLLIYTFQHIIVAPFNDQILNKLEVLSLLVLLSFVFVNIFWAVTQKYDLMIDPAFGTVGKVLIVYEMTILALPVLLMVFVILIHLFKKLIQVFKMCHNKCKTM